MKFKGVSYAYFADAWSTGIWFDTEEDEVSLGDEIVLRDDFLLPGIVISLEGPGGRFARFSWDDPQLCFCELLGDCYCCHNCAFDAQDADGDTTALNDPEFNVKYPVASIGQLREVVRTL